MHRLCLYEWATAGGLEAADGRLVTTEPAVADAIRREGLAMLTALAAEAAACKQITTRVLIGADVPFHPPKGTSIARVPRGRELDGLLAAAAACDWLLPIAPETGGILERRLERLETAGCRLISPSAAFAAVAADKQATLQLLAAAGVPVPAGRLLRAGESPPADFHRPMVRKHRSSTGCDGLAVILDHSDAGGVAVRDERIEAFVSGTPLSVSVLCGPACRLPLPPVLQQFSNTPPPTYLGGRLPVPEPLVSRAQQLAVRAIAAIDSATARDRAPAAAGWVGVDMILGDRQDGRGDRVLEINPRITTSVVGLVQCSITNLIEALVAVASGGRPELEFADLSTGNVYEFASALPSEPACGRQHDHAQPADLRL